MNDRGEHRSTSVAEVDRVRCNVHRNIGCTVCVDCEIDWHHQLSVCDDFELRRVSVREVGPRSCYLEYDLSDVSCWYFRRTEEHAAVHKAREVDVSPDCGVDVVHPLVGGWRCADVSFVSQDNA